MSGEGSRARRVEAYERARADVYRRRGGNMAGIPFTCPRQKAIYAKAYAQQQARYWESERMCAELYAAYGHVYPKG